MNSEEQSKISSEIKEKISEWLIQKKELLQGIVFGSVAAGRVRPESDVDLAVLARAKLSIDVRVELSQELAALLGRNVDLVDLGASSGIIVKEALTQGVVLKNSDPDFFAKRLLRFYLDEADYGRLRNRAYKERRDHVFGTNPRKLDTKV